MLEARGLAAHVGGRALWQGLDLRVREGQILGLLGPNGVGKTTLLRCLAGLRRPDAGTVLAPRTIGYVAQQFRPGQPLAVADFVAAGLAAALGLTQRIGAADRSATRLALARVGATSLADRPVTLISGGESRLVLIARALVSGARVLVLDEPMAGLDLRHQAHILRLFRSLAAEGHAMIWSTHDPNHLTQAADHVLMMHRTGSAVLAPTALALTPAALRAQFDLPFTQVQTAAGPQFLPDFAQHEA